MLPFFELIERFWTRLQQSQLPQLGLWNYFLLASLNVWQGQIAALLVGEAASAGLANNRPGILFFHRVCTGIPHTYC